MLLGISTDQLSAQEMWNALEVIAVIVIVFNLKKVYLLSHMVTDTQFLFASSRAAGWNWNQTW
mgnify:CR=1 FL=1